VARSALSVCCPTKANKGHVNTPPRVRDPHAGNFHRASASDHTLGLRGREPGPDQLDQQIDGEAVVHF